MFEVQSFGLDTGRQSFCYLFIALSIARSKSAQKFAVWGCQVTTVVATIQLVLRRFKKYYID